MKDQKCKLRRITVLTIILLGTFNLVATESSDVTHQNPDTQENSIWKDEVSFEVEKRQPDGIIVVIEFVLGGSNNPLHLIQNDGFTILLDSKTRYYCWARQNNYGRLESTGYPVHLHDPNQLGLEKNIRMSDEATKIETESIRIEIENIRKVNPPKKGK